MVIIDAVVVPVAIPIVTTIESPTWPGKSWIDIPIRSIGETISSVVANVYAVANVNVCVIAKTRAISAKARSVEIDVGSDEIDV